MLQTRLVCMHPRITHSLHSKRIVSFHSHGAPPPPVFLPCWHRRVASRFADAFKEMLPFVCSPLVGFRHTSREVVLLHPSTSCCIRLRNRWSEAGRANSRTRKQSYISLSHAHTRFKGMIIYQMLTKRL